MRLGFLFPSCLAVSLFSFAQTATDIGSDPHYSLLLANDQVRVYQVSLRPGERSFVRHEHNFLVVSLQDCEIALWPEGSSDIMKQRFAQGSVGLYFGGRAIGLRNDQTAVYRNVTVEFLDPKVTTYGYQWSAGGWDYGASGIHSPVDPRASFANRLPLGSATAIDVQLLPAGSLPTPHRRSSELLIPVTDIDLRSGDDSIRRSAGDALLIPSGRQSKLVNVAGEPVRFTVVELPEPGGN
jgi:hypothetical protein